uniref:COP9 signalosome complex subunit 6 n=1 Tax=Phallusia mammillata TaxID=59560 RepID=A0A6F9DA04_9ASCI|nr:COP9 signalosome complex subunit 6 [Phallusia mammillata]
MASTSTSGSVSVKLHPLVIMNVSDHWTRVKAQEGRSKQVFGALIGKQSGRSLEVLNSFELHYMEVEGDVVIDRNYYYTKEEQFKQVFKDLDFLGWYTTGGAPNESDVKIHKQICGINESPIFLKLNPQVSSTDLPLSVYESVIDVADGNAVTRLVALNYTLATEEAERIGVDHIARVSNLESGTVSSASDHLHSQHNAISMLYARIQLVLEYVRAVKNDELPRNHEILRAAHALCRRLPVLGSEYLTEDLQDQYSDVTLLMYLGVMSKGSQTLNQFISKFNVLFDRHGASRRMRGLFL